MSVDQVLAVLMATAGLAYWAGRVRPGRRLGAVIARAQAWARRSESSFGRLVLWLMWTAGACCSPIAFSRFYRDVKRRTAYSRSLPETVTAAAAAVVAAHRPHDYGKFRVLRVAVFPSGAHDLTNVALVSAASGRIYLGLGNPRSSGLGEGADTGDMARTTEALDRVLRALRPPIGVLLIPLPVPED
ncbi:hypothetical protein [Streptomyces sp. NPDC051572]|uniref:hypothetical protein n=1 Tax=Streptomyces sp. NPDC051572 TaxID=3155802 RepID=UPI00345025FC